MTAPSRPDVASFLSTAKVAIKLGFDTWLPGAADRQHLIDLNITQNQALEYIQQLTPDNYSNGPLPDDTKPDRHVWVFGAEIGGTEAYIKLALQPDKKRRTVTHVLIWSFHKADRSMSYPLRQTK